MIKNQCEICKEQFEGSQNSKTCDDCKFKLSQMPSKIPYKERVKTLKAKYKEQEQERKKKKLSAQDKLLLFYCSKCLWCRKADFENRRVYCSLPMCKQFLIQKTEE